HSGRQFGSGTCRGAGAVADRAVSRPRRARAARSVESRLPLKETVRGEEMGQVSARREGVSLRRGRLEKALAAAPQGRLRAGPERGRGAGRVAALSRRRGRGGGRWRRRGGGRGRQRRDQGAGRLRDLSRKEREGEARAARGSDG